MLIFLFKKETDDSEGNYTSPTGTSGIIKLSYTTGLPTEAPYQPVMVVIENSTDARPHTGLQTADVVYEVPVEGDITRFIAVFQDDVPTGVMPVRSGRAPFLCIQAEWILYLCIMEAHIHP